MYKTSLASVGSENDISIIRHLELSSALGLTKLFYLFWYSEKSQPVLHL